MIDFDDTGFQPVASKRKRRQHGQNMPLSKLLEHDTLELQRDDWLDRVTPFLSLVVSWDRQPGEYRPSRTQLAGLIALAGKLDLPLKKVELYEPALSDQDLTAIVQLGLGVVSRRKVRQFSSSKVMEAFFGHNWERQRLENFVMFGNHLLDYSDIQRFTAWAVPQVENVPAAFNNVSVQFLPRTQVTQQVHAPGTSSDAQDMTFRLSASPSLPAHARTESSEVAQYSCRADMTSAGSEASAIAAMRSSISAEKDADVHPALAEQAGVSGRDFASAGTAETTAEESSLSAPTAALAPTASLPPESDTAFWALPWTTVGRYAAPVDPDSEADNQLAQVSGVHLAHNKICDVSGQCP
ncbi:hypothetical protein BKA62DRAFT_764807 [Auriculariales sp. MPI-PUGE-AT-0066]|nr:hypothetical protein BKA62DRAFT_764807 [Auriculariales sp. MPI-PUGE-AT-0066]